MRQTGNTPIWRVVYTRPHTERKVASAISEMGLETYLPMPKVIRPWSDRRKRMEIPLFPKYVFVKVEDSKRSFFPLSGTSREELWWIVKS